MSIWEDVYTKLKGSEKVPEDLRMDQNYRQESPADFPNTSGNSRPTIASAEAPSAGNPQHSPMPDSPPPPRPSKTRFTPRVPGRLTVPYPAILAKMRASLADTWANIMLETKQNIQTLLVCGATNQEGSTLIAYNLAMFLSKEYSMKVLYVDTNLNHAAVPRTQKLPGVYSFVSEKKDLASLVVHTEYPGLYLLPSGSGAVAKNVGSNMLSREIIENLINFCRTNFDMTIIDGQPLVSSPVMIEFAAQVEMTLLVCRYGVSRYEVSRLAVDKLQKFGVTSIGVIFNDREYPVPRAVYKLMG